MNEKLIEELEKGTVDLKMFNLEGSVGPKGFQIKCTTGIGIEVLKDFTETNDIETEILTILQEQSEKIGDLISEKLNKRSNKVCRTITIQCKG